MEKHFHFPLQSTAFVYLLMHTSHCQLIQNALWQFKLNLFKQEDNGLKKREKNEKQCFLQIDYEQNTRKQNGAAGK